MTDYTLIPGLEGFVLEESFVLGISATPGIVAINLEVVLARTHPAYIAPQTGHRECFKLGRMVFHQVTRLLWDEQGRPPALDATGEEDYGHIDFMRIEGGVYHMGGDWGAMEIAARGVTLSLNHED